MNQGEEKKETKTVNGGCEGPDAMYVKLISADGQQFFVKKEQALLAETITAMLSGPGQYGEGETNEINFRDIPSHVLQKVCKYLTYKFRYTDSTRDYVEFPIEPEVVVELLLASNFLAC